jgi:hypothetical protein
MLPERVSTGSEKQYSCVDWPVDTRSQALVSFPPAQMRFNQELFAHRAITPI